MKRSSFLKSLLAIPAAIGLASKIEAKQIEPFDHIPADDCYEGVMCINGRCMPASEYQCDPDPEYGRCVDCVPTPVKREKRLKNNWSKKPLRIKHVRI